MEAEYGTCPRCHSELYPGEVRFLFFRWQVLYCPRIGRCDYRRSIRGKELAEARAKFDAEPNDPDYSRNIPPNPG